jgi:hypothetical protein
MEEECMINRMLSRLVELRKEKEMLALEVPFLHIQVKPDDVGMTYFFDFL